MLLKLGFAGTLVLGLASVGQAQTFQGLGSDYPQGHPFQSRVMVSRNGSTLVATFCDGGGNLKPKTWAVGSSGWTSMASGALDGYRIAGLSGNATYFVGSRAASGSGCEGLLWSSGGGLVVLPDISGGVSKAIAVAVSDDGLVAAGAADGGGGYFEPCSCGTTSALDARAAGWSISGTASVFDLDSSYSGGNAFAMAMTPDGSAIVGKRPAPACGSSAFIWTSSGIQCLTGSGGGTPTIAGDITPNGDVVVGTASVTGGNEACRWSGGTFQLLGDLSGGSHASAAAAVTDDGNTVYGIADYVAGTLPTDPPSGTAFIWDARDPTPTITDLKTFLSSTYGLGTAMSGWDLVQVWSVSGDGSVIVGDGVNNNTTPARREAWLVILPSCAGDLNRDGFVDFTDYTEFLNLYGSGDLRVDFTYDAIVDYSDYLEFMNHYNAGC